MRGNGNKNQEALHVASAWSKEGGVCFGQKGVDGKGKEIGAIVDLLDTLSCVLRELFENLLHFFIKWIILYVNAMPPIIYHMDI